MPIYRGSGGAGDATNDATISAVQTYATQAATSATQAATSATNAATSASGASTSATNAANSATTASGYSTTAAGHASSASTYATNSSLSADDAAASALEAQQYASEANDAEIAASLSESNASDYADAAQASQLAAETATLAAVTIVNNIDSIDTVADNITNIVQVSSGIIPSRVLVVSSSNTITVNADICDIVSQINTTSAGTLTISAPAGTPQDGQRLVYRIQCTNAQTLSWNAVFEQSTDILLPSTTTGSSKVDYYGFFYNSNAAKWQLIAKVTGF